MEYLYNENNEGKINLKGFYESKNEFIEQEKFQLINKEEIEEINFEIIYDKIEINLNINGIKSETEINFNKLFKTEIIKESKKTSNKFYTKYNKIQ